MPPSLPEGDPAPPSGQLPPAALAGLPGRPFGVYVHVPYCRVRCGYCDFNTYALPELGPKDPAPADFLGSVSAELDLAHRVLGAHAGTVQTVFLGGGTPTLLSSAALAGVLAGIRDRWGLAPGAEVTVEANPDTVTPQSAQQLAAAGYTRISLGMQSTVPHVLATLERTHDPAAVPAAVSAARAAGLSVSLDLIYGTPGESLADWTSSLQAALALAPEHVSAYALVVEDGTRMGRQVARGELPLPEADDQAAKYELADDLLTEAGYRWYEVSNWSLRPAEHCRHNLGYWRGGNWWGIGPGAHSHVGGVRWWNHKRPSTYAARLRDGRSPAAGRETLDAEQRLDEEILLGVRLADGLPVDRLPAGGRAAIAGLIADGLLEPRAAMAGRRVVLTRRGRLLADLVVHHLIRRSANG